jgi:hypothetical protein
MQGTQSYPDIRVKYMSIRYFTATSVTLYADVSVYKTESCSNTMFHKKTL